MKHTKRKPGFHGNSYFAEDTLIEISQLMQKSVQLINSIEKNQNADASTIQHTTKVAMAYLRKTIPLHREVIINHLGTSADPESLLYMRNLILGESFSQAGEYPPLSLFLQLSDLSQKTGIPESSELQTLLLSYISFIQAYDQCMRQSAQRGSITLLRRYALPEDFVVQLYCQYENIFPGDSRILQCLMLHPHPDVIDVRNKVIEVEARITE